jgi:hypothetical protein
VLDIENSSRCTTNPPEFWQHEFLNTTLRVIVDMNLKKGKCKGLHSGVGEGMVKSLAWISGKIM